MMFHADIVPSIPNVQCSTHTSICSTRPLSKPWGLSNVPQSPSPQGPCHDFPPPNRMPVDDAGFSLCNHAKDIPLHTIRQWLPTIVQGMSKVNGMWGTHIAPACTLSHPMEQRCHIHPQGCAEVILQEAYRVQVPVGILPHKQTQCGRQLNTGGEGGDRFGPFGGVW